MSLLHFVSNMTQFKQINPQFTTRTIIKGEPFFCEKLSLSTFTTESTMETYGH